MTGGIDNFKPAYTATELGISSGNVPTNTSTASVATVKGLLDTSEKDGKFTLDEIMQLKIATQMAISDPQLPPGDKEKLQAFYTTLSDATTHIFHNLKENIEGIPHEHQEALNQYMMVNCVLDLFQNTNELSKLYTQMMRSESKLGQKLGMVFIEMAKDVFNSTIASGEREANNLLADASAKQMQAAVSGLKAASTGVTHLGKVVSQKNALKGAQKEKTATKTKEREEKNAAVDAAKTAKDGDKSTIELKKQEPLTPDQSRVYKDARDHHEAMNKDKEGFQPLTKEQWRKDNNIDGSKPDIKSTLEKPLDDKLTFDEKMRIKQNAGQGWDAAGSISNNLLDGSLAAGQAGTDITKAANILEKSKLDAARGFSQSMMETIKETMQKLHEDQGNISQIMNKLWGAVEAQQQVSTKQWQ